MTLCDQDTRHLGPRVALAGRLSKTIRNLTVSTWLHMYVQGIRNAIRLSVAAVAMPLSYAPIHISGGRSQPTLPMIRTSNAVSSMQPSKRPFFPHATNSTRDCYALPGGTSKCDFFIANARSCSLNIWWSTAVPVLYKPLGAPFVSLSSAV